MKMSESITNLATALAKAQSLIKPAIYDSNNPHFRSRYASLTSVMEACRDALSANQIAVIQDAEVNDKTVTVTTMLLHASGEFISSSLSMPFAQATPQAIGSSLTYAKRYSLSSLVGITSDEDDDGEAGSNAPKANGFKDVQVTLAKESGKTATSNTTEANLVPVQTSEVSRLKESKAKKTQMRAAKIREIFQLSTEIGMSITSLKEFISKVTGKSIAESSDLAAEDLPVITEELQKLVSESRKAA